MTRIESRFKEFTDMLSRWWSSSATTIRQQRADKSAELRRQAKAGAHRAATRVQDFRTSERGQRAAGKISDLRASEPAKRAEAAFHDLRATDAARKAEGALADLRQRDRVKKAEESARKVMHDLFSDGSGSSSATRSSD